MNFMEFSGLTRIASANTWAHKSCITFSRPQVVSEVGTSVASPIASFVAAVVAPKQKPHHPNVWGNTNLAGMKRGNIPSSSQRWKPGLTLGTWWKSWVFFGSLKASNLAMIWTAGLLHPIWSEAKATPDPPTVSVSSSTNTQIDLAWTPGFVFRWNLEMGDVCFFVVPILQFKYTLSHCEQYNFVFVVDIWI